MPQRLGVQKTYKLFLGGKFPRTESGRYLKAINPQSGEHLANYCHASRKDLRDAVRSARAAQSAWAEKTTAYLKGQILYRAAEMLDSRRASFAEEIASATGATPDDALFEVDAATDLLVYFSGWADKYQQVFGSVNPVASSHFNFSTPEPTGVVFALCPDSPSLAGLVATVAPIILSGNSCVALASESSPLSAISFAEAIATCDLPGGVLNILTGKRAELTPHAASHMDINAIVDASGDPAIAKCIHAASSTNLKRTSFRILDRDTCLGSAAKDPYPILDTVEIKSAWHPIGV